MYYADGADVNVWDDEPITGPLPPNPRIPPPSPEPTRDRPTLSSSNSVSNFFFPPSNEDGSIRKSKPYNHFTLHSSSVKETKLGKLIITIFICWCLINSIM